MGYGSRMDPFELYVAQNEAGLRELFENGDANEGESFEDFCEAMFEAHGEEWEEERERYSCSWDDMYPERKPEFYGVKF